MSVRRTLLNTTMLAGIVGGMFLSFSGVRAADIEVKPYYKAPLLPEPLPAVDGFNGKWEVLGGTLNHRSLYGSRGSFSIPLATQWGLQIDGAVGALQDRAFGSIAPHLFWRDPSRGLLGLYASHTHWDRFGGVHVTQVAGEGEAYWGRFTLQGIAGVEFGNSVSSLTSATSIVPPVGGFGSPPGIATTNTLIEGFDVKTRFFDQVNLKYYFTDDVAGYIGHRYLGGKNALAVGAEAALPLGKGVMGSAFVEARAGESQFNGVWGGLRFYFGQKDKTLIKRQREDDPVAWDTLHSILNNYNASGSSRSTPFCTPPQTLQPNGTCETIVPSDIRLKRDIVLLARIDDGLGLYRYRYLWSDETYVGVMAQEVAKVRPDAIVRGADGYLRVNYDRLGVRFMTFDEWTATAAHSA